MPYFAVTTKDGDLTYITSGANQTDAVLPAYRDYAGADRYEDQYEEAGGGNELAEQVLAEVFDCTEIHRAMVLEYVERRLDGDGTICILL
jgi:hypothetical protein